MSIISDIPYTGQIALSDVVSIITAPLPSLYGIGSPDTGNGLWSVLNGGGWASYVDLQAFVDMTVLSIPFHSGPAGEGSSQVPGPFAFLGYFQDFECTQYHYKLYDPWCFPPDPDPTGELEAGGIQIWGVALGLNDPNLTTLNFINALAGNTKRDFSPVDTNGDGIFDQIHCVADSRFLHGAAGNDPPVWQGDGANIFSPPPRWGGFIYECAEANGSGAPGSGSKLQIKCWENDAGFMEIYAAIPDFDSGNVIGPWTFPIYGTAPPHTREDFMSGWMAVADPYQLFIFDRKDASFPKVSFIASAPYVPPQYRYDADTNPDGISFAAFVSFQFREKHSLASGQDTAVKLNSHFHAGKGADIWTNTNANGVQFLLLSAGSLFQPLGSTAAKPVIVPALVMGNATNSTDLIESECRVMGILWDAFLSTDQPGYEEQTIEDGHTCMPFATTDSLATQTLATLWVVVKNDPVIVAGG